jgi:hypothetical protein
MTDDEARMRRAGRAGRKAISSKLNEFRSDYVRELAEIERAQDHTPEAARRRAELILVMKRMESFSRTIAAMMDKAGDPP